MARARMRDERGASLVEYALMVALIAVVCIVAISFVGESSSGKFETAYHGIKHGQAGPNSTGNVVATCDTSGECTFVHSSPEPGYRYDWEFPGGDYRVNDPTPDYTSTQSSYLAYGWKYEEGYTHNDPDHSQVVRVWCDRQSDGSYSCR